MNMSWTRKNEILRYQGRAQATEVLPGSSFCPELYH